MTITQTFLALLAAADAVTIDEGALLTGITAEPVVGTPENEVVCFNWTDGECDYIDVLTEDGIANGTFNEDGKFICENRDGDLTTVRFFKLTALKPEALS